MMNDIGKLSNQPKFVLCLYLTALKKIFIFAKIFKILIFYFLKDLMIMELLDGVYGFSYNASSFLFVNLFAPLPLNRMNNDWFLMYCVLPILLITMLLMLFPKYIDSILEGMLNYNLSNKLIENKNVLFGRTTIVLNGVFFIVIGAFLYQNIMYFAPEFDIDSPLKASVLLSASVLILFQLKRFLSLFIANVFNRLEAARLYNHETSMVNMNMGLLILPLVFLFPYVSPSVRPFVIYTGLFLLLVAYCIYLLKSFTIMQRHRLTLVYTLLFFIFIDIIPITTLVKLGLS